MIDRVIAVDWSGARDAARRKIWLCEVAGGRVERLERGRSREEVVDHLVAEARRDPSFAVGLDFAFSFPARFLEKRGHRWVDSVWREVEEHGEAWLADCPSPPFWGKPGKRKPAFGDALHRATELEVREETGRSPLSVFQIGGVGAVGVASIRGMPALPRLRAEGFSIWPFDEPAAPLVVEVWPRAFMGGVVKSRAEERRRFLAERHPDLPEHVRLRAEGNDDAFDALVTALGMDRHRGELKRVERADDARTRLEGAIWLPGASR